MNADKIKRLKGRLEALRRKQRKAQESFRAKMFHHEQVHSRRMKILFDADKELLSKIRELEVWE